MALLWTDGIGRYGASADLSLAYSTSGTFSYQATAGVNGGPAIRCQNNANVTRSLSGGSLTAGNGVHFANWISVASYSGVEVFIISTNQSTANVTMLSDGTIQVTEHGSPGTVLASSIAAAIPTGAQHHFEYAAKYNTSGNGGYIKVWLDGVLIINFSGTTSTGTVPTAFTALRMGRTFNNSPAFDHSSLIIWDESGTDFALTQISTTYLPVIETISIASDASVQWTPNTGTNHGAVDDPAFHNSDTDYNSSTVTGQVDTFNPTAQASTPNYTFAIALKTVSKIDIAGIANLRTRMVSGGTTTDSADISLTTTYALHWDGWGKDPNTSAVWGTTQVNSITTGYKYQS